MGLGVIAMLMLVTGCGAGADGDMKRVSGSSGQEAETHRQEAEFPWASVGEMTTLPLRGDQVIVSRSIDFGTVNARPYGIFADEAEVEAFTKAIRTGDKINGMLDVDFPDYDVVVDHGGVRQIIHLWLDQTNNSGMYTYTSDTGTGYTLTDKSAKELIELIWERPYTPDQAAANGDVVVTPMNEVRNTDRWHAFASHVRSGIQDELQVAYYTKEGSPIFRNIMYSGDSLRLRYDTTHDAFGKPLDVTDFCDGIKEEKTDEGTIYTLAGCEGGGWFELAITKEYE